MDRPIFYDASGKRSRWSKRVVATLLFLIAAAAIGLGWTIAAVPAGTPVHPVGERIQARPLTEQFARLRHGLRGWLPPPRPGAPMSKPISVAFYAPWDPDSRTSLVRNVDAIDWVVPAIASYTGSGQTRSYRPDANFTRIVTGGSHRPRVLPLIQNAANDKWDGAGMGAVLRDPAQRKAFLDWSERVVLLQHANGIVFDLEELPADALPAYRTLLSEARRRARPDRLADLVRRQSEARTAAGAAGKGDRRRRQLCL